MSNLTNEKLLELIDETLAWGSEVAEKWSGTLYEKQIDSEQAQILKAVDENDLERAYTLTRHLAQTLEYAEIAYEESDR